MTLLSKQLLPLTMVLAGSVALAACSPKPSPWSESSSPWEAQAEQTAEPEPLAINDIEPAYQAEETIEPVGYVAAEEETAMVESSAMAEESVFEEPPMTEYIEEPMEPMEHHDEESAPVMVGGSLSEQPSGMFAVQVVASSSMDQLSYFASQNQLSNEWIAEITVDGKVWFVLMSGLYSTKSEAEDALTALQDLGTEPWIRTVGSVQSVMNQ